MDESLIPMTVPEVGGLLTRLVWMANHAAELVLSWSLAPVLAGGPSYLRPYVPTLTNKHRRRVTRQVTLKWTWSGLMLYGTCVLGSLVTL